eukprot:jgi/Ulvmu1/5785/UM025_0039.1
MTMPMKKLLRLVLDRTETPAVYECGFDDTEEEISGQRLRMPGQAQNSEVLLVRAEDSGSMGPRHLSGPIPAVCIQPDSTFVLARLRRQSHQLLGRKSISLDNVSVPLQRRACAADGRVISPRIQAKKTV